jgi:hypothetical protein
VLCIVVNVGKKCVELFIRIGVFLNDSDKPGFTGSFKRKSGRFFIFRCDFF